MTKNIYVYIYMKQDVNTGVETRQQLATDVKQLCELQITRDFLKEINIFKKSNEDLR